MKLSILHMSDLHRDQTSPIGNRVLIDSLERDRDRYAEAGIMPPNLIIVSGDIVQGIAHDAPDPGTRLRQQYDEAFEFLTELAGRFVDGDKTRIIIVPGNHDVSNYTFRRSLSPLGIADNRRTNAIAQLFQHGSCLRWSWKELQLYEIADVVTYDRRFSEFCEFYERFYDGERSYSVAPDAQGVRLFFVDGPISLSGGGEAGGNWIRQGVVRSGGGSGGRRYFCRQRPMGDFRWSSRAS